jgi:hypothetical protein
VAEGIRQSDIYDAIDAGDAEFIARGLRDQPEVFRAHGWRMWMGAAADAGRLRVMELLVAAGADVNEPKSGSSAASPEGVIDVAAAMGHLDVVRWLLDRGARVNHEVLGQTRCFALVNAVRSRHLDVVKLLVERGAAVNACWAGLTPLDHAMMYGRADAAEYLRSVGGKTAGGLAGHPPPPPPKPAPPRLKEGQPAVAGAALGKWRTLFEGNLPPAAEREYGAVYEFGPPATADELAAAEKALRLQLPADVRELLAEFNGVWDTTAAGRAQGQPPNIAFLDVEHLSARVPAYLADTDNPLPPKKVLRKVVWVAQSNGLGDLWGVCAEPVGPHKAGAVVRLDHEAGELEPCQPDLAAFVRAGRFPGNK